ncbi:hypothetical protein KEF29_03130 [Streptomyces tuirus]|uniref:Terminase small subunit n=1 Tax=Streptomyces tuirus TaxID=68278 RepID=A0A941FEL5_9ACTN|nr:hypothetical protein [Streptomyces tuirus]
MRRDRDAGEWTILPADGRQGATPDWPLSEQSIREAELWEALWLKPQAIMWERFGQELEVALYVRRFSEAELMDSRVNLSTLIRQMADSLGLTTPGMRANRWRITAEEPEPRAPAKRGPARRASARTRLKVVPGDGD